MRKTDRLATIAAVLVVIAVPVAAQVTGPGEQPGTPAQAPAPSGAQVPAPAAASSGAASSSETGPDTGLVPSAERSFSSGGGGGMQALTGYWVLGQPGGKSCTISLLGTSRDGKLYDALVPAGCPDGFFQANRWRMNRGSIELTDSDGARIGRLSPSGSGGSWIGRHDSDGAPVFMRK